MIILGLSHLSPSPVYHDVSAALIQDGVLRSAISEERLSRVKHAGGFQPNAIQYCLDEAGIKISDVDRISVGFGLPLEKIDNVMSGQFCTAKQIEGFPKTSLENKKPLFYNHQYIHARTGYAISGFDKATIISLDGGGQDDGSRNSGGIFVGDNGSIDVLKIFPVNASLGFVFGCITEVLGFRMIDGEGKTMTMAAFGESKSEEEKSEVYQHLKKVFPVFENLEHISGGVEMPKTRFEHNSLLFKNMDDRINLLVRIYSKEAIAWAAQKILEEIVVELIRNAVQLTGIPNVVLTGGIFLNMIMNMIIRKELGKEFKFFFNPIAGDFGNAVGVCFEEYMQETGKTISEPSISLYLGTSYSDEEVKYQLSKTDMHFKEVEPVSTASELINDQKIIGWFQGKSEFGPRALGNRSILSLAKSMEFRNRVNLKIKKRESWRPFCPSITNNFASEILNNVEKAPYMIEGFKMKNPKEHEAVSHVDGSCRPQILERETNPMFHDLIDNVGGIVLNTSFNLAGEPIVERPIDAIMTMKYSDLDALIINNYLVTKD